MALTQNEEPQPEKVTYGGGATSTKLEERFDLIPYEAEEAMARRFGVGVLRHGERNWESGDEEFAKARLNHLRKHLALFCDTRKTEDLDAVICNAAMLCRFRAEGLI